MVREREETIKQNARIMSRDTATAKSSRGQHLIVKREIIRGDIWRVISDLSHSYPSFCHGAGICQTGGVGANLGVSFYMITLNDNDDD